MNRINPKISVLMPVFNGRRFLKQAIESILHQTYSQFIFIIVNDASTDDTPLIISKYHDKRIHIINNRIRKGLTASLNIGLQACKSEYIARMDADDIALPNRLLHQLQILDKDKNLAMLGTWVQLIDERNKKIGRRQFPTDYARIKTKALQFNPISHPTVMLRRKVLDKFGVYDENLDGAEDYDLFLRIARDHNVINIPEVLLQYRVHDKSVSWQQTKKVEKAAIDARLKALLTYHYPLWQSVYLAKPLLSFLIPLTIKRWFIKIFLDQVKKTSPLPSRRGNKYLMLSE